MILQSLKSPAVLVALVAATSFSMLFATLSQIAAETDPDKQVWVARLVSDPTVYAKPFANAAIGILATGLVGGILKIVLDVVAIERKMRDERLGFLQRTLDDVKAVNDRVERARIVMLAHRSVKTYGKEMRDLIDARVQLINIKRAYELTAFDFGAEFRKTIIRSVSAMIDFVNSIVSEFQQNYKRLADMQRAREHHIDAVITTSKEENAASQITEEGDKIIWAELQKLPKLRDLLPDIGNIGAETEYERQFGKYVSYLTQDLRIGMEKTLQDRRLD